MASTNPKVAILGAGLSGMCMAIKLKQAGLTNFTVYEKAHTVGGTWRDNIYPGVACDVPSHLYSFSFARNPDWSHSYSGGEEIQNYCERVTDQYDLRAFTQFNKKAQSAIYKDGQWYIGFADGSQDTADILVGALGGLHQPSMPDIAGQESFEGEQFHSARWRSDVSLEGKRVAVIGSAASAVQIVPEITKSVKTLTVYQRTPNWVFPRDNLRYSPFSRWLSRTFPFLGWIKRSLLYLRAEMILFPLFTESSWAQRYFRKQALKHLEDVVPDADLRKKLTPNYPVGCKRILFIDNYFETLQQPHVTLETNGITQITKNAILTKDGASHPTDVIIYATGFKPFNFLDEFTLTGPGGRNLRDHWKKRIESHRTVAVAGFPNFFMLLGPNSGLGHNSVIIMIEAQVRYIVGCIKAMRKQALTWMEPRKEQERAFNDNLQAGLIGSVWKGSCKSWYKQGDGENHTLWPWSTIRYIREMRAPKLHEYRSNRNTTMTSSLSDAAE